MFATRGVIIRGGVPDFQAETVVGTPPPLLLSTTEYPFLLLVTIFEVNDFFQSLDFEYFEDFVPTEAKAMEEPLKRKSDNDKHPQNEENAEYVQARLTLFEG